MALRDILVKFGIDVGGKEKLDDVDKKLKKAKDSAFDLDKTLRRIGAAFVGKAIADFVLDTIAMADALKHNAERLGVTTDELQKYQYVSDVMGVTAQQTAVGLRFFNRAIGEAALGTKSAVKVFDQLGVKIRDANGQIKPTDDLLFEVADKLAGVKSQAERTAIAMRLLGRGGSSMLPMLQEGSVQLRKYFKDVEDLGGGFNDAFVNAAHETDYAIRRLKLAWRSLRVALVTELLPAIGWLVDRFTKAAKVLIDASKHTFAFASSLRFLIAVLGGAAVVFAALNAEMIPVYAMFGALAVAVGFLYLIFDDFYTFMQGQPSVLGDILGPDGGAKFRADIEAISKLFGGLLDSILGTGDGSKTLAEKFEDLASESVPAVGKAILTIVEGLDDLITDARNAYHVLKALFYLSPLGEGDWKKAGQEWDLSGDIMAQRDKRHAALDQAMQDLTVGAPSPIRPRVPGMGPGYAPTVDEMDPGAALNGRPRSRAGSDSLNPGNMSVTIQNTFHVAGSADPKAVGAAAADGTKRGMKDAAARDRDTYDAVTAGLVPALGT